MLHAIPWEPRGAFLVASWNLLRPRETRALDLDDFDASKPAIAIYKAVQGPRPDAPVGTTKNRTQSRREVWDDELLQWLAWRLEQATPEAKLRDEIALFWCPTARNAEKRWSDDPLRQEWNRACVTAKVPHIPLYQGTKHTTATALAEGGIGVYALKALGGWKDSRSAEHYLHAAPNRAAIVKHLPGAYHERTTNNSGDLSDVDPATYGGADGTRTRKLAQRPALFPGIRLRRLRTTGGNWRSRAAWLPRSGRCRDDEPRPAEELPESDAGTRQSLRDG